jgi:hypothetical protein
MLIRLSATKAAVIGQGSVAFLHLIHRSFKSTPYGMSDMNAPFDAVPSCIPYTVYSRCVHQTAHIAQQ